MTNFENTNPNNATPNEDGYALSNDKVDASEAKATPLSFTKEEFVRSITGETNPNTSATALEHAFNACQHIPTFANRLVAQKARSWESARSEYATAYFLARDAGENQTHVLELAKALGIAFNAEAPNLVDVVAKLVKGWRSPSTGKWTIEPTAVRRLRAVIREAQEQDEVFLNESSFVKWLEKNGGIGKVADGAKGSHAEKNQASKRAMSFDMPFLDERLDHAMQGAKRFGLTVQALDGAKPRQGHYTITAYVDNHGKLKTELVEQLSIEAHDKAIASVLKNPSAMTSELWRLHGAFNFLPENRAERAFVKVSNDTSGFRATFWNAPSEKKGQSKNTSPVVMRFGNQSNVFPSDEFVTTKKKLNVLSRILGELPMLQVTITSKAFELKANGTNPLSKIIEDHDFRMASECDGSSTKLPIDENGITKTDNSFVIEHEDTDDHAEIVERDDVPWHEERVWLNLECAQALIKETRVHLKKSSVGIDKPKVRVEFADDEFRVLEDGVGIDPLYRVALQETKLGLEKPVQTMVYVQDLIDVAELISSVGYGEISFCHFGIKATVERGDGLTETLVKPGASGAAYTDKLTVAK